MATGGRVTNKHPRRDCRHVVAVILTLVFVGLAVSGQAATNPKATPTPQTAILLRPLGPARTLRRLADPPVPIATPNLAVFYSFDPDVFYRDNPRVPADLSDFAHPTINSGAYPWRPGRLGSALRFGFLPPPNQWQISPTFLTVSPGPTVYSLDMISACTIASWVLPERLGGRSGADNLTILARGASDIDNSVSYAFGLDSQGFPFLESRFTPGLKKVGPWRLKATNAVKQNDWHHVCVVFHPYPKVIFYIDGTTVTISTAPSRYLDRVRKAAFPLFIAARYADDRTGEIRDPFFGCLDDVALWNRVLTWEEIRLLPSDVYYTNGIADFWDMQITGPVRGPVRLVRP